MRRSRYLKSTTSASIRQAEHLKEFPIKGAEAERRKQRALQQQQYEQRLEQTPVSAQLEKLKQEVPQRRLLASPLRNRAYSVDPKDFTPSRTQSITVAYGSPAFQRRFGRRSDNNLPLPADSPHLRALADSQLLRHNRDAPNVDERRVLRGPGCMPESLGRVYGLNGEEDLSTVPRGSVYSDITKYQSRSIDPHSVTQSMLMHNTKRRINVMSTCNGGEVKAQVLAIENRFKDSKKAAGKPLGEDNYDREEFKDPVLPNDPMSGKPKALSGSTKGPGASMYGWQLGGRTTTEDVQSMKASYRDASGKYIL